MERNPFRVLDCKNERCQTVVKEAPVLLDHLSESSKAHFAGVRQALDELGVTILDARIVPMANGYNLDTYHVLEYNGEPIADSTRLSDIQKAVWRALQREDIGKLTVTRRAPRQVRMFSTPIRVHFSRDHENRRTVMELIAGDRPGLLSEIGKVFISQNVRLQNAKIVTLGERAEDVFYIWDQNHQPLSEEACKKLRTALVLALDTRQ